MKRNQIFYIHIGQNSFFEKQDGKCKLSNVDVYFANDIQRGTASLDRIDSSQGYVKGNVQWVHKIVNNMKQHHPQEEFIFFCKQISKHN